MNALRSRLGCRRSWRGEGGFGFFDRSHGVHHGPCQTNNNRLSTGHIAIAHAGHNAVSQCVAGEPVDIDLWSRKGLYQFVFHSTHPPLSGALSDTNSSYNQHDYFQFPRGKGLDHSNFHPEFASPARGEAAADPYQLAVGTRSAAASISQVTP